MEQTSNSCMDSPIHSPPLAEPFAPSSPPPPSEQHQPVDPSRGETVSSENPTPSPPPPAPISPSPPHPSGDSSPTLPSHVPAPSPSATDASPPPVLPEEQTPPPPPPRPSTPPAAALAPSPPPSVPASPAADPAPSPPPPMPAPPAAALAPSPPSVPASPGGRSEEHEEADSASETGSMTLALALTQTEETMPPSPPKASLAEASPVGSPPKESAVTIAKLLSGEDPAAAETKPAAEKVTYPKDNGTLPVATVTTGGGGSVGSKRWLLGGSVPLKVRRAELRRAELGFRISAAVFCLISLSVMAADTTPGWSGDSFRRYNEYRYVLAASVVAFTYSGFQLVTEVHYLVTRRHIIQAPFRSYFNLAMDQILAYLLLSASSAALSRNDVWISRFGGDQFTKLVNASASMAFLAFVALGLSSVISSYCVFNTVS